jgi:hypothetical protein
MIIEIKRVVLLHLVHVDFMRLQLRYFCYMIIEIKRSGANAPCSCRFHEIMAHDYGSTEILNTEYLEERKCQNK